MQIVDCLCWLIITWSQSLQGGTVSNSIQSHYHPFPLTLAPLTACCFLLMEISLPPASFFLYPSLFSLCCPYPPLHFHFTSLKSFCCASSLAYSVKLIDSKPSLRGLCISFSTETNQSQNSLPLSRTINQQMIHNAQKRKMRKKTNKVYYWMQYWKAGKRSL